MPTGRCAGCERTGPATKIAVHVLSCSEYVALYRQDRARCLDPVTEYLRHRAAESTTETHARDRDKRLADKYAVTAHTLARQAARFATPADILDD